MDINVINIILLILCIGILIGLLYFGLSPFDFFPKNNIFWLLKQNGIHFHGKELSSWHSTGGIIHSQRPITIPSKTTLFKKSAFSIEFWLEPFTNPNTFRARIFTLHGMSFKDELIIFEQWMSHGIIYWKDSYNDTEMKYHKIGISDLFAIHVPSLITITSGDQGTYIYLNGNLHKAYPTIRLLREDSIINKYILLGNSTEGLRSWSGNLFSLVIYANQLTQEEILQYYQLWIQDKASVLLSPESIIAKYIFKEKAGNIIHDQLKSQNHLYIPKTFDYIKKYDLLPDFSNQSKISILKDIIVNIVGFIPFGFFYGLCFLKIFKNRTKTIYLVIIIIGFLIRQYDVTPSCTSVDQLVKLPHTNL